MEIRYENAAPIFAVIRDSMRDPGQRSYLFLLFLDRSLAFSGHFLTPYLPGRERQSFSCMERFLEAAERLIREVRRKDEDDRAVHCFEDWLSAGIPSHADAVLFLTETEDGDWQGCVFDPAADRERSFSGRKGLHRILQEILKRKLYGMWGEMQ